MSQTSNYQNGYQQALTDIIKVFTPIVHSFPSYIKSGNVFSIAHDVNDFISEINILNGRNKL